MFETCFFKKKEGKIKPLICFRSRKWNENHYFQIILNAFS